MKGDMNMNNKTMNGAHTVNKSSFSCGIMTYGATIDTIKKSRYNGLQILVPTVAHIIRIFFSPPLKIRGGCV